MAEAKEPPKWLLKHYSTLLCKCKKLFAELEPIEAHIVECKELKTHFGELIAALVNSIKMVGNKNDYNLVRYLFYLQKQCMRQKLNNARQVPEFNPKPSVPLQGHLPKNREKLEMSLPLQQKPELLSFARVLVSEEMFGDNSSLVSCAECRRLFPDESNTVGLSCKHSICLECAKNKIFRDFPDKGQVLCSCKKPLTEKELQVIFALTFRWWWDWRHRRSCRGSI